MGRLKYFLGLFVLAGVLSMMLALGGLIASLAIPIGSLLVFILPLADLLISKLREMLGENEFNKRWLEGQKLTMDEAIELALSK